MVSASLCTLSQERLEEYLAAYTSRRQGQQVWVKEKQARAQAQRHGYLVGAARPPVGRPAEAGAEAGAAAKPKKIAARAKKAAAHAITGGSNSPLGRKGGMMDPVRPLQDRTHAENLLKRDLSPRSFGDPLATRSSQGSPFITQGDDEVGDDFYEAAANDPAWNELLRV